MKNMRCAHEPLVEGVHDQRLGSHERGSVERHLVTCTRCSEHQEALKTIGEAIRSPRAELLPIEHQRARAALLRRAVGGDSDVVERRRPRAAVLVFAVVFAVAAVAFGWAWGRAGAPVSAPVASGVALPRETMIVPGEGARFERSRSGGLDTVILTTGSLRITTGSVADERFVVKTADAELSPKASSFVVEADDGKIRNVLVERGTVEVRYAGFIAVIPGGGSWKSSDVTAKPREVAPVPSAKTAPSSAVAPSTTPAEPVLSPSVVPSPPTHATTPAPKTDRSRTLVAEPASSVGQEKNEFSEAMRSLERGEYDAASSAMADFARAHPDDARADEADYMRVIALQRAGHVDEAKAAAVGYLAKWPRGSHRSQVAPLAR